MVPVLIELSSDMNIIHGNRCLWKSSDELCFGYDDFTNLLQSSFIHQSSQERNLPDLLCCHYWLGSGATEMNKTGPHKYICEECKLKAAAFN